MILVAVVSATVDYVAFIESLPLYLVLFGISLVVGSFSGALLGALWGYLLGYVYGAAPRVGR